MRDQELVNNLRTHLEAARKIGLYLGKSRIWAMIEQAADRIANQNTHILALQKEIEGLRRAARWVHDGLYLCDPDKNTACKKSGCKKQCFHTAFLEFADAQAEPPAQQPRWIPVNENLYPGTPNRAGDGSGCNPFHAPAYVLNPAAAGRAGGRKC